MNHFCSSEFFPDGLLTRLIDARVKSPDFAWNAAQVRVRREHIAPLGKLNILAADHPARNVTSVGQQVLAMADRRDYLARILRVLSSDRVDGIMATMDILEDLLAIDGFLRAAEEPTFLDNRVLIASLNRGGLAGSSWELDDPMTGATPSVCRDWKLDGAKTLLRVDPTEPASLKTMLACAQAINECNALGLPMFLEPLPVTKTEKGFTVVKTAEALARLAGVASALGDSSRYLWLKLPYCDGYETVARATTLPILLLGGESAGDPAPFLRQLESAMSAGGNVRGAMVGRNVLYPGDHDPLPIADAAGGIIHSGWPVDQAIESMAAHARRRHGSSSSALRRRHDMTTRRMTMAQALVCFLKNQYVERDGQQHLFFGGMLGIFGHGNVAGIGQALQENPDFRYIPVRNEQSSVHLAVGFAKASNRLRAMACTSSIGPGATNMITGAALATINRLPVLLLPGDIFARRNVAPVLQQIESTGTQDTGVNDCFKPVSRYWDRIYRPEQLITALPEAMRVLTSPSECGAVTLSLPQDVQTEAYDYPEELFRKRVWLIRRGQPDSVSLERAVEAIRAGRRPIIVAGGGVLMSEASEALAKFASTTGIPVGGDAGRQGLAGMGSSAGDGSDRCDGFAGIEPAGSVGRSGDWDWHAILRFHVSVHDRVPESRCAVYQYQHCRLRRI